VQQFAQWLQATPLSIAIQSTSWLVPLLQSIQIAVDPSVMNVGDYTFLVTHSRQGRI
jgi:hypothetical protein